MKVAIAHDYLNQYGGAERVLGAFFKLFPDAHLYTLTADRRMPWHGFGDALRGTSFLDIPFVARHHRLFIPLMPLAARTVRFKDRYDLVISATAGYAKGVRVPPGAFHLSYCYTPLRYAWESDAYLPWRIFAPLARPLIAYLRSWDRAASERPHAMVAISEFIREKIRRYYGRDAAVVYPPVDGEAFYFEQARSKPPAGESYYLAAGRLLPYKKFDVVIQAFRNLELPLKIVGVGREARALRRLAAGKSNISFVDFVSDEDLRALYAGARAFIMPQAEDFGLVAAEAQRCGTPVVAFAEGGALEIVEPGKTGVLFEEQSVPHLIRAVQAVKRMSFNRAYIARRAKLFSFAAFKRGILAHIPVSVRRAVRR